MEQYAEKERLTFTEQMRARFKGILDPVAALFNRLGILPNTMTIIGLIGNTIGAFFLSQGSMVVGGLWILAMGPVDALDGTMARLRGESGQYGAFVDSVTDRYSELVIYGGLLYHFLSMEQWLACALTYLAAVGTVLTSYIRARAQSLGYETKVGVLTRLERYMVLSPALIVNQPLIGVLILAIGSNVAAIQRLIDVRRQGLSR